MNSKWAFAVVFLFVMSLGVCAVVGCGRDQEPSPSLPTAVAAVPDPRPPTAAGKAENMVPAPEFTGVTTWLNSKPLKLADQKGKVVVVHFWTNGCINCIHNYPHYRSWQEKYQDEKHLLIIGIHTPEFDAEKDVDRIKDRMAKNKLTFAVAVDNDGANWKAWGNHYWPCVYLVDKNGTVRHRWEGELGDDGYKKLTGQIDKLLSEKAK